MNKQQPAKHRHLISVVNQLSGDIPSTLRGFRELEHASLAEGALSTRTKELMALAIAVAVRCEGCITCRVYDALEAGATPAEITESIGVAVMMGGEPALMCGAEAYEALHQYEEERNGKAIRTGA
jgi:AhpD family alkylhydroperoxidase